MRTRPVRADELDLFVEAGGTPDHRNEVRQYLESMLAAGSMRPGWCFVVEEEDRPLGRVAFWTLPGDDRPRALVLLDVPWEGAYLSAGVRLLRDVLDRARRLGVERIEHVLDAPPMYPQFEYHPEQRTELLEDVGFSLKRRTIRFEWRGDEPPLVSERFSFRTLEEVGEEAFVDAIARVSEGTLDQEIQNERKRMGPQGAARAFFEDASGAKHGPSWWRLAYSPGGELVGLVMPAESPALLTVFYIGVVPEMRGHGYIDDLLAAGTATLLSTRERGGSDKLIRADTDVGNAPMAAAFRRAGWVEFASRREFAVDLIPDRAHA